MRPEKILLVEENRDEGALATWLLKTEFPAAEVRAVGDLEAVEEALSSGSYDLVLTGNHFSWGNGQLVLSLVRRHLPGCSIMMLTACGSEEVACEALKSGFADYLPATARGYLRLGKRVRSVLAGESLITASGLVARYERLLELVDEPVFVATRGGLLLRVNSAFSRLIKSVKPEQLRVRSLADFLESDPLLAFLEELDPKGEPKTAHLALKEAGKTLRVKACLVSQGDRLPIILVGRIEADRSRPLLAKASEEQRHVENAETRRFGIDQILAEKGRRDAANFQANGVSDSLQQDAAPDKVDLRRIVDLVIADLRPLLEQSKATVVPGRLPAIAGSHEDMVLLLRNLLSSLLAFPAAEPTEIHITAHRMPTEWLFIVRDSGAPIVESRSGPMSARDSGGESRGLGGRLGVCRQIVERHGGQLWIGSEPGIGSSIYFTLRADAQGPEQEQVNGNTGGVQGS